MKVGAPVPAETDWSHPFGYGLLPDLPPAVPRRGGAFRRWLGTAVLRGLGWRLVGPFPDVPKVVVAGAYHTSNWDGVVGLAAVLALRLDMGVLARRCSAGR